MKKTHLALAALAAMTGVGIEDIWKNKQKKQRKNPNNAAVKIAEKKRAMRAEKLRKILKGGE